MVRESQLKKRKMMKKTKRNNRMQLKIKQKETKKMLKKLELSYLKLFMFLKSTLF